MDTGRLQPIAGLRADAGRTEAAHNLALLCHTSLFEHEDLLHGDDVAFHAGDLRNTDDFTCAVTQARLLNDDLNRCRDLLAHRALGQVGRAHGDHGFDSRQRVARRVRVDRRQRPVVTGVHRLEHVEGFLTAGFADDYAVWTHTQGVHEQLPLLDGALAFDVRRPRLQPRHVFLVQLQFGGVLDGDDALAFRDETREHVQKRRLAGARASADQHVQAAPYAVLEELEHRPRQGP